MKSYNTSQTDGKHLFLLNKLTLSNKCCLINKKKIETTKQKRIQDYHQNFSNIPVELDQSSILSLDFILTIPKKNFSLKTLIEITFLYARCCFKHVLQRKEIECCIAAA